MRTHKLVLAGISIAITFSLVGCQGSFAPSQSNNQVTTAPTAAFTASATTITAGQTVQFTDASTGNPTSWSWVFGDSATSTAQNPSHTYASAGSYTVTLTARNSAGASSISHSIEVNASTSGLSAGFSYTPSAPVSAGSVAFTDMSTGSPTSWSWSFGDGATSSLENPSHIYATRGTFAVSFTASNADGSSMATRQITVAPESGGYNMTQTLSDEAQSTTVAFDGLALITGNLDAQSFFPPGKVSDYTGFQYLRDNDPDNQGHNTDFLTRVANNVIYILTDSQMEQLKFLASTQLSQVNEYAYQRYVLMNAFLRNLTGDIPSESQGLNLNAVKQQSEALYQIDGQMAFDRAVPYVNVYNSMTSNQVAYLEAMKGKGFNDWPNITDAQVDAKMRNLAPGTKPLVMTYASDIFSWYEGSLYADVYFCPERHGTYYGGFYIKDAPAMGVSGYNIDEGLTRAAGSALIDPSLGYVTQAQATPIANLANVQRNKLYAGDVNIISIRRQVATLLRSLMESTSSSSEVNQQVLTLSATYGDLDGENNYYYATAFAALNNSLTDEQQDNLAALRHSLLSGAYANGTPFDFTVATTPYLYSDPIMDASVLTTYLNDSDLMFFEP
jgi:PKD repeat protein